MTPWEITNTVSGVILVIGLLYLLFMAVRAVRIVPYRTAQIVERLGRYQATKEAGIHFLVPFIDKVVYKLSLKEESFPVPPQECFTKDTVRVEVEAVIYISVTNPTRAAYGVTDYRFAAVQLAQTTIRAVIGELELDEVIEERAKIKKAVVERLSEVQEDWGIKVHRYEVKRVIPPQTVNMAMERQNNATRMRDALLKESTGKKESLIKKSEGRKAELVNYSEGEKQRRINEAEGKAQEILSIAEATAGSIEQMAEAIQGSDAGEDAVRMRLSQKYLGALSRLGKPDTEVVLPANLADLRGLLANVSVDGNHEDNARPKKKKKKAARRSG